MSEAAANMGLAAAPPSRKLASAWHLLPWALALLFYFIAGGYLSLGTHALIMILFALSLDLALGQAGIITLGHAAFFGFGAYAAGIFAAHLTNEPLLGLVVATVLQAHRGAQMWFVSEGTRPEFMRWLWANAWVALVLGALALALALWRGGVRFGPLAPLAALGRRSMAEQISGTAQFLHRQGGAALHAAQLRALDAAATAHLRGYARMDRSSRAQALAHATGLDAAALGLALDRSIARRRIDLPPVLELLETARRLLVQSRRP